jgi:hypothetical protein
MTQDSIVRTFTLARATFYTFDNVIGFDLSINDLINVRRANVHAFACTGTKVQIDFNPLACFFPSFYV